MTTFLKSQINNLTFHLKTWEEEQTKLKRSRKKEIIKTRVKISEIEKRKATGKKINESKSWCFGKINKVDKPLARLTKKKRQMTQISNVLNIPLLKYVFQVPLPQGGMGSREI